MRGTKKLFIRGLFMPGIALCALLFSGTISQAAPVTFNFTGLVSDVSDPLSPPISVLNNGVAQQVHGSFTVNFTPNQHGGTYLGVVTGFSLKFDGTSYSATYAPGLLNGVQIYNSNGINPKDKDSWKLETSAAGTPINGFDPIGFKLELKGKDMFTNDDLQRPNLGNALSAANWRLNFEDADEEGARVKGVISSLTAVPLPAAVVLFGAGLISLVGLGAGGLRNLRKSQA